MPAPRPGRVLVGERALRSRIAELGAEIAPRFAGEPPVVVGVLQGAFLFMADLVRAMPIDLATDFVRLEDVVSSADIFTPTSPPFSDVSCADKF